MHHCLVSVWVCLFKSVCLRVCRLDLDFQTKMTLALRKSQAQSAAFGSASTLVVRVTDRKPPSVMGITSYLPESSMMTMFISGGNCS